MPLRVWSLGLLLVCVGLAAAAQDDPPGRVARLSAQEGRVSFSPAGDDHWYDVAANRPLAAGDRIWADRNTRAELQVGSAAVRLDALTLLEISELSDQRLRMTVQRGNVQVRVRDDMAGERIEFDTANLATVIGQPGQYQVAIDPDVGLSQVAVDAGSAVVYGENGESRLLAARQQIAVSGRDLTVVTSARIAGDDFVRWVAERNRSEDQSVSARYVSREMVGYQQLDGYGDWQNDTRYGAVWYPRHVDTDWAPYREGSWVEVAPWGLTWIDSAPWGFAPSHYGRWARFGTRWGWVPGQRAARPVYAPALVGFIGGGPRTGSAQGVQGTVQVGPGRNGVGWFPLAPGEAWRPDYRASQRYIDRVNRSALTGQPVPRLDGEAHLRRPESVTVVPADVFGRGPIGRRDTLRLPEAALAEMRAGKAPSVALPPHFAPGIGHAPAGFVGRPVAVPLMPDSPGMPALQSGAVRPQTNMPPQFPQQRVPLEQARTFPPQQDVSMRQQESGPRGMQQAQQAQLQQAQQRAAQQQISQQQQLQQQAMRQAQETQQRAMQQQQQQQQTQQQAQQIQQRAVQQQMQQQQRAEERQSSAVRPKSPPGVQVPAAPVARDRLHPPGFSNGNSSQ